jgi:polyphenol oxidase
MSNTQTAPPALTADALSPFRHGFFGRRGGVSVGIYGSLNCGLGSNDERDAVLENRTRVATAVGLPAAPMLTCHQIHSADVIVVEQPFAPGPRPKADGLVTRVPGLLLGALAADCMPILFAAPKAGVVAAAHAGWKGALSGVAEATIAKMETLGAKRDDIRAVIGPCISGDHYEVGEEFRATFVHARASNAQFFRYPAPGARPLFDLPGYMLQRLGEAGVTASALGVCTYAREADCFSYRRATHRRESDYGRQVAVIAADRV